MNAIVALSVTASWNSDPPVEIWQTKPLLTGNPYHSPKLHPGTCSSVGMRWGTDRPTYTHTHTDGRDKYTFHLAMPIMWNVITPCFRFWIFLPISNESAGTGEAEVFKFCVLVEHSHLCEYSSVAIVFKCDFLIVVQQWATDKISTDIARRASLGDSWGSCLLAAGTHCVAIRYKIENGEIWVFLIYFRGKKSAMLVSIDRVTSVLLSQKSYTDKN